MIDKGHILLGDSTMGVVYYRTFYLCFQAFFLIFSAVLSKLRPFDYQWVSIMQGTMFLSHLKKIVDTRA